MLLPIGLAFLFSSFLIPLITFLLLSFGWSMLKPYLTVHYYLNQGAAGYFKPFGGFFHDRITEARQQGDFFKYFKDIIHKNPNTKAVVSNVGSKAMIYLMDSDLIKEFLNQPHLYEKAEFFAGVERLVERHGIFFSQGETWKKQRKLLTSFFQHELLQEQVPLIFKTAEDVYALIGKTRDFKDLKHIDIQKINQRLAGDVIGTLFFDARYPEYTFEGQSLTMGLKGLLHDTYKQMYTPWNTIFGARFIQAGVLPQHKRLLNRIKSVRNLLKSIIEQTRRSDTQGNRHTSLLLTILEQQQRTPENSFTDDEIIDTFISLFFASTDPAGNLLSMILYYLTQNQEVYQKTMSEINTTLGTDQKAEFEQLQKMDYLSALIKETLRKANPQGILVFREALEDHQLKDFTIKRGSYVTFSPILNGYNAKYFTDYNEFKPSRWLPEEGKVKNPELKKQPFAFIPFSAGPRTCVGQHLALVQTKVLLSSLLRKFKVEMSKDYELNMTFRGMYEPLESMKMSLSAL